MLLCECADADVDEELASFLALLDKSTIDEEFRGSQLGGIATSCHNSMDASSVLHCGLMQLACEFSIHLLQGVISSIRILLWIQWTDFHVLSCVCSCEALVYWQVATTRKCCFLSC